MFRSSSPFSLNDFDMWDTKTRFTAQTSAWCGMAAMSGTGFGSQVGTSLSGSSEGFITSDPGLRKWQSLSHLENEGATRPFPPSPGAELRAARGDRFRQAEAGQWMLEGHKHLINRNSHLSYNNSTAQFLDMKNKFSGAITALKEKETAEFEVNRHQGELHEKVHKLETELLQMRTALGKRSSNHPIHSNAASLSKTLPQSEEDLDKKESQKLDAELNKLREAEARAKTSEEERNQAMQKLHTSMETQRMLLSQMDEMNEKLNLSRQNQSEVKEQLSEANNKISQACLEKAILSTQVLKLEDNIKELRTKLTGDLSDKEKLIKEKSDLQQRNQTLEVQLQRGTQCPNGCEDRKSQNNKQDQERMQMSEELKALQEVNAKLTCELEVTKQKLTTSQFELVDMTAERHVNSKQITDLKAEHAQLVREKDKLYIKMNEDRREELKELTEKCCQLRKSEGVLESEKLKMQEKCMCLEAEVLEKEEKLQVQKEEHRKQDAARVQVIKELRAVAAHWSEKWQKAALTLQATQEELEALKKNNFRKGFQTEAAPKKEGQRIKNVTESLQQSSPETCKQEPEGSRGQVLPSKYKCIKSVQTQDARTDTALPVSSVLWEPTADSQSQDKPQMVKEGTSSLEGRKDYTVCAVNPETDQQRKLITEQLKNLFKMREEKEMQTVDSSLEAAQTGASPATDQANTSKAIRKATDWRVWQQGSGLMPVFEEDEEGSEEEEKPKDVTKDDDGHSQNQQLSTLSAGINNLKEKHDKMLQASLRCKQEIQHDSPKASDKSSYTEVPTTIQSSEEIDLQTIRPPSLYPDGIFQAELVDICSPDEDEG